MLALFIVSLLMTTSTLAIAHQQPAAPVLPDIQPCGDRICVLGIVPNLTSFEDALAILRADPRLEFLSDEPAQLQARSRSEPFFDVTINSDQVTGLATVIHLYYQSTTQITASDIIGKFGQPCFVDPYAVSDQTALHYPNIIVFFSRYPSRPSGLRRFYPSARMVHITLFEPISRECSEIYIGNSWLPWRGFRVY